MTSVIIHNYFVCVAGWLIHIVLETTSASTKWMMISVPMRRVLVHALRE